MGTSRCRKAVWFCILILLFVLWADTPPPHASREAVPVSVSESLFIPQTTANPAYDLNQFLTMLPEGITQQEFDAETKRIRDRKTFLRQAHNHAKSRYQYLLASRSIHLMRYAEWEKERLGKKVAAKARQYIGKPYAWGGTTPSGFDCSGFAQYVLNVSGIHMPRNSYEQYEVGQPVSKQNLRPGDLVFFTTYAPGPSHLGIYIGNGKFVHALNQRTGVVTSDLDADYYKARYLGAKRVL
ncbi:MAG TPA: C40 family peptidase [Bacilli bacterium]|nr:C40 family peptidase [Bacilli bacterium]